MKSVELTWTRSRRNLVAYSVNKFISFAIAVTLAVYTLHFKKTVQAYTEQYGQYDYSVIYWLLFIFYSFQAIDELIEYYSVLAKREKGPIGLLFEMNYFVGLGLTIWIIYFLNTNSPPAEDQFKSLYDWLNYQIIILYIAAGVIVFMLLCFSLMQARVSRKTVSS